MLKANHRILICLILMIAISSAFLLFPSTAKAGGGAWIVNTVDDTDDGICDSAHCSLREAINHVNTLAGNQLIWFDIPGPAPHIIQLCSLRHRSPTLSKSTAPNRLALLGYLRWSSSLMDLCH